MTWAWARRCSSWHSCCAKAQRDQPLALLIAPTSVVGNWEHEVERFAPSLELVRHYGSARARAVGDLLKEPGALVRTTYGLLRRDAKLLAGLEWSMVALDENVPGLVRLSRGSGAQRAPCGARAACNAIAASLEAVMHELSGGRVARDSHRPCQRRREVESSERGASA